MSLSLQGYCQTYESHWSDLINQQWGRAGRRTTVSESRFQIRQYFLSPSQMRSRTREYNRGLGAIHEGESEATHLLGEKYAPAIMHDSAYTAWRIAAWAGVVVALLGISVSIAAPFVSSKLKLPLGVMIGGGVGASVVGGALIAKFLHYSRAPLSIEKKREYVGRIINNIKCLANAAGKK